MQAQWGAVEEPPCTSCGNHFKEGDTIHIRTDLDPNAKVTVDADELTPKKLREEERDNYYAKLFGMDLYRTDSLYDSMDRLDKSLGMLQNRRNYYTKSIKQREAKATKRFGL